MNTLATLATLIIYSAGIVACVAMIAMWAWALSQYLTKACNDAYRELLRYRRLSWLRYWAARLERERPPGA